MLNIGPKNTDVISLPPMRKYILQPPTHSWYFYHLFTPSFSFCLSRLVSERAGEEEEQEQGATALAVTIGNVRRAARLRQATQQQFQLNYQQDMQGIQQVGSG